MEAEANKYPVYVCPAIISWVSFIKHLSAAPEPLNAITCWRGSVPPPAWLTQLQGEAAVLQLPGSAPQPIPLKPAAMEEIRARTTPAGEVSQISAVGAAAERR